MVDVTSFIYGIAAAMYLDSCRENRKPRQRRSGSVWASLALNMPRSERILNYSMYNIYSAMIKTPVISR